MYPSPISFPSFSPKGNYYPDFLLSYLWIFLHYNVVLHVLKLDINNIDSDMQLAFFAQYF